MDTVSGGHVDPTAWADLETKFRLLSAREGSVYLPNVAPTSKVKTVLIGMEPSLGHWAPTPEKARKRVEQGLKNFLWSSRDFVIQYIFRRQLGQSEYHLTDMAKGAMLAMQAAEGREDRYDRWFDSLLTELRLACLPGATVIAIGNRVGEYLDSRDREVCEATGGGIYRLPHYSSVAVRHHLRFADDNRDAFEAYMAGFTREPVVDTAKSLLQLANVEEPLRTSILGRLEGANFGKGILATAFRYERELRRLRGLQGAT